MIFRYDQGTLVFVHSYIDITHFTTVCNNNMNKQILNSRQNICG